MKKYLVRESNLMEPVQGGITLRVDPTDTFVFKAADVEVVVTRYQALSNMLQLALGALADIGTSSDMTLEIAQKKAARIYNEVDAELARLQEVVDEETAS